MFYAFSFPPGVYVGALNLIASIPGPSILTLLTTEFFQNHVHVYDRLKFSVH